MLRVRSIGWWTAVLVSAAVWGGGAEGAAGADTTATAGAPAAANTPVGLNVVDGLTSTKEQGVVSVMSDPALSGGQLILKVVAKNRTQTPSSFGPANVTLLTAAGTPVKLITLDQLVAQTKAAAAGSVASGSRNMGGHDGPIMTRDSAGRPDVTGYTGGNQNMAGVDINQVRSRTKAVDQDPKVQQQIASLNAAILHDVTIAPAAVAGGQLVTEKLKFGRKEVHELRLVVEFNGERHEFNFAAPPEG